MFIPRSFLKNCALKKCEGRRLRAAAAEAQAEAGRRLPRGHVADSFRVSLARAPAQDRGRVRGGHCVHRHLGGSAHRVRRRGHLFVFNAVRSPCPQYFIADIDELYVSNITWTVRRSG